MHKKTLAELDNLSRFCLKYSSKGEKLHSPDRISCTRAILGGSNFISQHAFADT